MEAIEASKSFFRLSFLLKMVVIESDYLKSLGAKHRAKSELTKMSNAVNSGFNVIKSELKYSGGVFDSVLKQSDEKIQAMHNILTALSDMPEDAVLEVENAILNKNND